MKKKVGMVVFLSLLSILIIFLSQKRLVIILQGTNTSKIHLLRPVMPLEKFWIEYTHSVYKGLIKEEFQVGRRGGFELEQICSNDVNSMEFYQLIDGMESTKGIHRKYGELILRTDSVGDYHLFVDNKSISLKHYLADDATIRLLIKKCSLLFIIKFLFYKKLGCDITDVLENGVAY